MAPNRSHWPLSLIGGGVSLANLFLPLVLVRALPPEFIGQYKIFFLYVVLVPWFVMTAGLTNGLSYWAGHDDKKIPAFRNSWTILFSIALVVLTAGVLGQSMIAHWLGWSTTETRLFLWCAFVQILSTFYEEASVSQGQIWRGALFSSGFDLSQNTAILTAALIFRNVEAIFWANLIVMTTKLVLGVGLGYRAGYQRFDRDPVLRKSILRYATPVSVSAALQAIMNYSDQLLLAGLIAADQFAIYTLGCLSIPPLLILETSVNRVVIPKLSRAFATGAPDEARKLLRESTSELPWIFIPSTLGLMIFAEPIVQLLFTSKYAAAAVFLRVGALRWILMSLPLDQVPRARARGGWILKQLSVFSAVSVALVFVLAKLYGALGAQIGILSTIALTRINAIFYLRRTEGWGLRKLLPWRDWATYAFFASLATAASYLIKPLIGDGQGGLHWFFIGGSLFSVIYMGGTLGIFLRRRLESSAAPQTLDLSQFLGHPTRFSLKTALTLVKQVFSQRISVVQSRDPATLLYGVFTKIGTFGAVRLVHTRTAARSGYSERFFMMFANKAD